MKRATSIFTQYWFSIGIFVILSLSFTKRSDFPVVISKPVKLLPLKDLANNVGPNKPVNKLLHVPQATFAVSKSKQPVFIENETHIDFIQRFTNVAINEMEKYDIPASIILAHALVESNGVTGHQNRGHNFFNIPCMDTGNSGCVKQYKTAWLSFRDHSNYLTTGSFKYLTRIPRHNLTEWARGIQAISYPNQPDYASQILDIIKWYELSTLDTNKKSGSA